MSQPPGMTRQRVVAFVESQPDRQVCIACIGRALGVPHKAVHTAMLKIEAIGRISRAYARCTLCGKTRIGVTAFSGLWKNAPPNGATSARSGAIFEDASTSVDDDGDSE